MTRLASALIALLVAIPAPALAQADSEPRPIIPPCPWWHCEDPSDVVVELYEVDASIDNGIATTRITQVLRNRGEGLA